MKRTILSFVSFIVIAISAQAMSYEYAQREALFLTDKMAYELRLSTEQMNAVYEINLDYLLNVNINDDVFGIFWERRNSDLRFVLTTWQYRRYKQLNYFYRPLNWVRGAWSLNIYGRYTDRHLFYFSRPESWGVYRGGRNIGTRSYYQGRNYYAPNGNGPIRGHIPAPSSQGRNFRNGNPPSNNNGYRPGQGPDLNGNPQRHFGNGNNPSNNGNRPNSNNGNRPNSNNGNNRPHFNQPSNNQSAPNTTGSRSSNRQQSGQGAAPQRHFGSHQ